MLRGLSKRYRFLLLRFTKIFLSWNVWEYACMFTWGHCSFWEHTMVALQTVHSGPRASVLNVCTKISFPRLNKLHLTPSREQQEWALASRWKILDSVGNVQSGFVFDRAEELGGGHLGILKTVSSTEPVCNWAVQTKQFNCNQLSALTTNIQNGHVLN